ncbi:MAG: phosphotransferase [Synergistaceae bacterium]|nr:phosphotransferase [Synergistaceae bacterium]
MKFSNDNDVLTVYLSGRIDANNSADIESEIAEVLAKNPDKAPVFDAGELEYISSAGLRVLLKLRKQFGKNLDVINTSNDVYSIFEVTGFTELLNVKKKLREISLEGLEVIGGGGFSTVYRLDSETIVKVFTSSMATLAGAEKDRMISREVFLHDIPTAIAYDVVKAGDKYGLVYEMIDADTVAGTISKHPERLEELSLKMARLMKKLHTTEFAPGTFPDARDILHRWAQLPFRKGLISAEDKALIDGAIDRIPARNTFVHMDYHPKNVMLNDNELVLIDVGDSGLGHPIVDLLVTYAHLVFIGKVAEKHGKDDPAAGHHSQTLGLDRKMLASVWEAMMPEYFGTTDTETLKRYEEIIGGYAPLFMLCGICLIPMPDEKRAMIAAPLLEMIRKTLPTLKPIEGI